MSKEISEKLAREIDAEIKQLATQCGRRRISFEPEHDDYLIKARAAGCSWRVIVPAFQKRFGFAGKDSLMKRYEEISSDDG